MKISYIALIATAVFFIKTFIYHKEIDYLCAIILLSCGLICTAIENNKKDDEQNIIDNNI
jgi:hypothetical protein